MREPEVAQLHGFAPELNGHTVRKGNIGYHGWSLFADDVGLRVGVCNHDWSFKYFSTGDVIEVIMA